MIFNVPGHIEMIRDGTKTQTRRLNRGIYQVERDYAVQRKRGVKAESDIRIVMDEIWSEISYENLQKNFYEMPPNTHLMPVTLRDANSEGYVSSSAFEEAFRELNPKWDRKGRWVFKFHAIEVQK
jgi:hypothetical protein